MRFSRFLLITLLALPAAAAADPQTDPPAKAPEKSDVEKAADKEKKDKEDALKELLPSLGKLKEELAKIEEEHGLGKDTSKDEDKKKLKYHWEIANEDGWGLGLDLGLIADWDANQSITGIDEGQHLKLGGMFTFITTFKKCHHEWRSKFEVLASYMKTPTLTTWIKSRDELEYETSYFWTPFEWFGLFGQADFDTHIFPGLDIEPTPVTYKIVDALGNELRTLPPATSLVLSNYFMPFYFAQMLGVHFRPLKLPAITMEIKAGAAGFETLADGQLKYLSRSADVLTIRQLTSYIQIGPYIGLDLFGIFEGIGLTYRLSLDAGYALHNTGVASANPSFADDLHFEGEASATFNPFKSVGITVNVEAHYMPNISPDIQFQNKIFLNLPVEL